ncbi:MAG TPA: adenylosuccinate synthase [Anaerolineales bacterium]|nr:adenylosuccinate synthase [Anaerolineales bacterium]
MPLDIIIGTQWGDEGKGRVVDLFAAKADYVARYSGGDNAGHTVTVNDQIYKLHLIPSGIVHSHTTAILGNGMVINPATLLDEMSRLRAGGVRMDPKRLRISYAAHLISPAHRALDAAQEKARGREQIGTTLRGIGPAYTGKVARYGIRMGQMLDQENFADAVKLQVESINQQLTQLYNADPLDPQQVALEYLNYAKELAPYIGDVSVLLTEALHRNKSILAEGAQGTLLDLDHGTYPYVTSSWPTAPGALIGLGIGFGHIGRVVGVTKAFQTRVGGGPFPTEVEGDLAMRLRGTGENPWDEYGTTTGRPRRVGWLDSVLLHYAIRINGLSELAVTKLDVLTGLHPLKICVGYRMGGREYRELPLGPGDLMGFEPIYEELPGWDADISHIRSFNDLPLEACDYIVRLEDLAGIPVRTVSVGPERSQVIHID